LSSEEILIDVRQPLLDITNIPTTSSSSNAALSKVQTVFRSALATYREEQEAQNIRQAIQNSLGFSSASSVSSNSSTSSSSTSSSSSSSTSSSSSSSKVVYDLIDSPEKPKNIVRDISIESRSRSSTLTVYDLDDSLENIKDVTRGRLYSGSIGSTGSTDSETNLSDNENTRPTISTPPRSKKQDNKGTPIRSADKENISQGNWVAYSQKRDAATSPFPNFDM
jgi:hypothetical protein